MMFVPHRKHTYGAPQSVTEMKNCVFWDVTPCDSFNNRRFGGTSFLKSVTRRNILKDGILRCKSDSNFMKRTFLDEFLSEEIWVMALYSDFDGASAKPVRRCAKRWQSSAKTWLSRYEGNEFGGMFAVKHLICKWSLAATGSETDVVTADPYVTPCSWIMDTRVCLNVAVHQHPCYIALRIQFTFFKNSSACDIVWP
jgi:hypothetical protein